MTGAGPDLCPDVFDPTNRDDGDGDLLGAVCDACIGVRSTCASASSCSDGGDPDGDGAPNGCDCDRDGDGCPNPGEELVAGAAAACAGPPFDRGLDARPSIASTRDFSGNGVPDDCDLDLDSDGVPNADDNCPLGDGDAFFVLGVDDDPSQTDSGGATNGDLCDPLCPAPGAAGCDRTRTSSRPPAAFPIDSLILPGGLPIGGCLDDSTPCDLRWVLECAAASIEDCFDLGGSDLAAITETGQLVQRLSAGQLALDAPFVRLLGGLADLDGDGLAELIVASPAATACATQEPPPQLSGLDPQPPPPPPICAAAAGQLLVVSSRTGAVLTRLGAPVAGAVGASFAVARRTIAVGAPEALDDQGRAVGALYLYRVEQGEARLARALFGSQPGERFGDAVVALPADGPTARFLVGAPGASHHHRANAGSIRLVDEVSGVVTEYTGPATNGRMSRGIPIADERGRLVVVGLLPEANGGAGAVAFFHGHGPLRRVVSGSAGEALGTAGVAMPVGLGAGAVIVSAPGADGGQGELLQFTWQGQIVGRTYYYGERLGTGLVAISDTNGDAIDDVAVGIDYGGPATIVLTALDDGFRGHHGPPGHPARR